MFFVLSSFAIDSVDKNKSNQNEFEITNYELISKNSNVDIVTVYCYVTIRNTETGETRKVYGIGSTLSSCGRKAYALARKVVNNLNNQ